MCACVAQGMSEVSVLKWTVTVWCVFYRVLFYSVQWLYCVCTPQSTRTGGRVCFTLYSASIVCVQATRTGGCVCFIVYIACIVCVLY